MPQVPFETATTSEYHHESRSDQSSTLNPLHRPWMFPTSNHSSFDNNLEGAQDQNQAISREMYRMKHPVNYLQSTIRQSSIKKDVDTTSLWEIPSTDFNKYSTLHNPQPNTNFFTHASHSLTKVASQPYIAKIPYAYQPQHVPTMNEPDYVTVSPSACTPVSMASSHQLTTGSQHSHLMMYAAENQPFSGQRLLPLPPIIQTVPSVPRCQPSESQDKQSTFPEDKGIPEQQIFSMTSQIKNSLGAQGGHSVKTPYSAENELYKMQLNVRKRLLQTQFDTILSSTKRNTADWATVHQLGAMYQATAADIESRRLNAMCTKQGNNLSLCIEFYNQLHEELLGRIEKSLRTFERNRKAQELQSRQTTPKGSYMKDLIEKCADKGYLQPKSKHTELPAKAIEIMNMWFQRHSDYPYPSREAYRVMSEAGSITLIQARKWFANKRIRSGFTKGLKPSKRSAEDTDIHLSPKRFKADY